MQGEIECGGDEREAGAGAAARAATSPGAGKGGGSAELLLGAELLPIPALRLASDGTVVGTNGVLERELGLAPNALTGRALEEIVAPEWREAARGLLRPLADATPRSAALAFAAVPGMGPRSFVARRDGNACWLLGTGAPTDGERGGLAQARERAEVQTDEYAGVNAELARANQALEQQAQDLRAATATKARFLATMSHELRTPLNAVLGYAGLLRDGVYGPLADPQRRAVEAVVRRAKDLQRLVDDVLDLAKLDAGRLELRVEEMDPTAVLTEVRDAARASAAGKELDMVTHHALHRRVRGDRGKYRQVLLNLVSNAVKFTPSHGRVELSVADGPPGTFVTTVRDTGIGIAADELRHIFDHFQQLDTGTTRRYAGVGVGLALARRLVELMGGTIAAESTLGSGTTFTITLPLEPARDTMAAVVEEVATDPISSDPVVLAIDDDPEVIALLRDSLAPAHFRVVGALTGHRGLELARILDPLAITLDIMMPDQDGWQVLRELKDDPATRHIPVLIVSIVAERAAGFSLGVTDYLVKPVDRQVLIGVLERLRRERAGHTALVVDEDADARTMLCDLLESLDFTVRTSTTASEAMAQLEADVPAVLVLDALLPGDTLRRVLEWVGRDGRFGQMRTVLLTRAQRHAPLPAALPGGAAAVMLEASGRPEELLAELRAVLARVGAPAKG